MSTTHVRVLLALAALSLLAAGCDSGGDEASSTSTSTTAASTSSSSTSSPAGDPQADAKTITMKNFAFEPKDLSVPKGAVSVKLVNSGSAPHTFTIDSPKIDSTVPAGGDAQVLLSTGDKTELIYYCRFHRTQGMEGKITVSG